MHSVPHPPSIRASWSARLAVVATAVGTGLIGTWCWLGRSYYTAPFPQQVVDARHESLRSAGALGLGFGVAAVALIVLNLAYLLRRRAPVAGRLGSLRTWLDLHVVTGLLSAGCVLVHSAFTLRSAAGGVAAISLAIVVVTGVIGRFVLAHIPRTREGRELSLDEARGRFEQLREELSHLGLPPLPAEAIAPRAEGTALAAFVRLFTGDRAARAEHARYRALLAARVADPAERRRIEPTLRRLLAEAQGLVRLNELSRLMASWRFFHRWLALVLVGTAACHVFLALRYARFGGWAAPFRGLLP